MKEANLESINVIQITCIMNLLHRAALRIPSDPAYEGISLSQMASIGYIYFTKKDVYQRDLENHFELRRSTVSSSLSVLEKKGLIKRLPVSHDARLKKLVLTDLGMQLGSQVEQLFNELNDRMLQGLTTEEINSLTTMLHTIQNNLSSTEY